MWLLPFVDLFKKKKKDVNIWSKIKPKGGEEE